MNVFVARNPFTQISALSRMQRPPKVLIMTGDDDGLNFYEGSAQLFVALRRAGLPAELRVEDGGHDWGLWRKQLPDVLRFVSDAMKQPAERPAPNGAIIASGGTAAPTLAAQPVAMQLPTPQPVAQDAKPRPSPKSAEKPQTLAAEPIALKPARQ